MEIVVAVKAVPDPETRLRPNAAGTDLDPEGVKYLLSGYDESAVEQALLLKESVPGSKVRVISFGPGPRTEEVLRASIALGCDSATWVESPAGAPIDALLAARAIAAALRGLPHELVIAGKQSGDDQAGIFPSALAELLGVADYGAVTNPRWDAAAKLLTLESNIEGGVESLTAPLPALVALQQAWNDPRTAKLPNILKSRKAPIDRIPWSRTAEALGASAAPRSVLVGFRLPPPRTGAKLIEYKTPEEAAAKLVQILREEAKVFP
jgi:electron transfer flavoprotein beta subunit